MNESIRRMRAKRAAGSGGFTLIELLVVIVILGILAAVVVFAVQGVGDKGSSAAFATDVKTLRTAQEAYCAQNGSYAANDAALVGGRFLSEGGTLNRTVKTASGPCGGTGFAVVCKPTHPSCGSNGTFPDGNFDGSAPLGTWRQVGNLPAGSMVNGSMATMSNGKVLLFGRAGSASPPTVALASQGFAPGPMAVYDPATAAWTAAPTVPTPAGYPNFPNYNPLVNPTLIPLNGSQAECGSNCGKVFVAGQVGSSPFGGQARSIGPDYLNQQFFLFDPAAFDAGANPWTRVPDPPASANIGMFTKMVQIGNCTRASGTDCGKVLVTGGIDGNGIDPLSGDTYDPARFRTSLWDPAAALAPASWALTDPYGRTLTATSTTGSNIVTSPDANFTADDVGKDLVYVPGMGLAPRIVAVLNSTTAQISISSTAGGTTTASFPAILWVADATPGSQIASMRDGRVLVVNGLGVGSGDSVIYSPVTRKWLGTGNRLADLTYTCPGTTPATLSPLTGGGSMAVLGDGRILAPGIASGNAFSGSGSCNVVGAGTPPQNSPVFDASNATTPWSMAPGVCPCSGGRTPNVVTLPPAFGSKVLMLYALGSNPKRTVSNASTTNNSLVVTSATAAFTAADRGRALVGPNLRVGSIINTVQSLTQVTMNSGSQATGTGTGLTVSIGNGWATSALYDGATWTPIDPASAPTARIVDSLGAPMGATGGAGNTGYPTYMGTVAMLPNGQVLIAGGNRCGNAISTCLSSTPFTGRTDAWLYTPAVG